MNKDRVTKTAAAAAELPAWWVVSKEMDDDLPDKKEERREVGEAVGEEATEWFRFATGRPYRHSRCSCVSVVAVVPQASRGRRAQSRRRSVDLGWQKRAPAKLPNDGFSGGERYDSPMPKGCSVHRYLSAIDAAIDDDADGAGAEKAKC